MKRARRDLREPNIPRLHKIASASVRFVSVRGLVQVRRACRSADEVFHQCMNSRKEGIFFRPRVRSTIESQDKYKSKRGAAMTNKTAARAVSLAGILVAPFASHAQEQPAAVASDAPPVETVVVTGSLLQRSEYAEKSPVQVLSRE